MLSNAPQPRIQSSIPEKTKLILSNEFGVYPVWYTPLEFGYMWSFAETVPEAEKDVIANEVVADIDAMRKVTYNEWFFHRSPKSMVTSQ